MSPQDYIQERLHRIKGKSLEQANFKSQGELADFIYRSILSKKFRKYSFDGGFPAHLRRAIAINIEKNEPIKFAFPFGAYKLWRLEESPEADWAELFALMYYSNWLRPIADNYEPGVWFDFSSDDVIVERLNNIPRADTEAYARSFLRIIDFLKEFTPTNLKFTLTPVGSRYAPEEFDAELAVKLAEAEKERNGKWPELSDSERRTIELNVKLGPEQEADPLWREKNKALHDAYAALSKRRPYFKTEEKILAFTKPLPNGVAIGTTKTSIAKFWVGVGVLSHREDSFIESILSPDQLQKAQYDWQEVSLPGLSGKNFRRIRVLK